MVYTRIVVKTIDGNQYTYKITEEYLGPVNPKQKSHKQKTVEKGVSSTLPVAPITGQGNGDCSE